MSEYVQCGVTVGWGGLEAAGVMERAQMGVCIDGGTVQQLEALEYIHTGLYATP